MTASRAFGHGGSDHSKPSDRMNRHGTWSTLWGENISYGKAIARDVVTALIIDDGLRSRKHRKNIFNPAFNYAGAAFGPHARYHIVCSIDFQETTDFSQPRLRLLDDILLLDKQQVSTVQTLRTASELASLSRDLLRLVETQQPSAARSAAS